MMVIIVCMQDSTSAVQMERLAKGCGVPGRLIPVPRDLQVSCGLGWASPIAHEATVLTLAESVPHGVIAHREFEVL